MLWDVPGVAAGDAANLVRWSEWQRGASKLGALELGLAVNARCLLLHAEGREWFVGLLFFSVLQFLSSVFAVSSLPVSPPHFYI